MTYWSESRLEPDDLADVSLPGFRPEGGAEMTPAQRARVLLVHSLKMVRFGVTAFHVAGVTAGSDRERGESLAFVADAMRTHLGLVERAQHVLLAAVHGLPAATAGRAAKAKRLPKGRVTPRRGAQ